MPWSSTKFSQLILEGNVWRSVWRICMWILGLKGLIDRCQYHRGRNCMKLGYWWLTWPCSGFMWQTPLDSRTTVFCNKNDTPRSFIFLFSPGKLRQVFLLRSLSPPPIAKWWIFNDLLTCSGTTTFSLKTRRSRMKAITFSRQNDASSRARTT